MTWTDIDANLVVKLRSVPTPTHAQTEVKAVDGLMYHVHGDDSLKTIHVDSNLLPLLTYLWKHDVKTWCSCEGYPVGTKGLFGHAYLSFFGKQNFYHAMDVIGTNMLLNKVPGFKISKFNSDLNYRDDQGYDWRWGWTITDWEGILVP